MRILRSIVPVTGMILAALGSSAARGQDIEVLLLEGDAIPGVGKARTIKRVAVSDTGTWAFEVDTDHPNQNLDGVILKNGAVVVRESDPVLAPAGALVAFFISMSLGASDDMVCSYILMNTGSLVDDGGMYVGDRLLLQEGFIGPATGWVAGTTYVYFNDVQINGRRQVLARGYVDDPLVSGGLNSFVSILDLDAAGQLASERVIAKQWDPIPGQLAPVGSIRFGPDTAALSESGKAIFAVDLDMGMQVASDGTVYLYDGTTLRLLAQEGSPSPVTGRTWGSLAQPALSLNSAGDWTIRDRVDGSDPLSDDIIVRNDQKLVQEGDTLPALGGHRLTSFGNGGAQLTESGAVLWYGEWDDPDSHRNSGLFLDDRLIVQEGVTLVEGALLTEIDREAGGHRISPNGRWVIFEGHLRTGYDGAFLLDLESPIANVCQGIGYETACPCGNEGDPGAGCDNSLGTGGARLWGSGVASVGADTLALSAWGLPQSAPIVLFQSAALENGGLGSPLGDGLKCFAGPSLIVQARSARLGTALFGFGASGLPLSVGGSVPPAGGTRYYQALYRNSASFCTPVQLNSTNAVRVVWSP